MMPISSIALCAKCRIVSRSLMHFGMCLIVPPELSYLNTLPRALLVPVLVFHPFTMSNVCVPSLRYPFGSLADDGLVCYAFRVTLGM